MTNPEGPRLSDTLSLGELNSMVKKLQGTVRSNTDHIGRLIAIVEDLVEKIEASE